MIMRCDGKIAKTVYEDAKAMYKAGGITKERFQEFKDMCLVPLFPTKSNPPVSLPVVPAGKEA
ncbi:hypothetical protein ACYULU_03145 [Breznakiellaceae bacterium SP9]